MRPLTVCLTLLAGPLVAPLAGQVPSGPAPARIDSIFARYDRSSGPGCALGVYRDGAMAYARGYGMADLNQGIAISPGTVFYIASTSKQFAALSVALLAEQGKLSLDDPVRKHVPELPAYADSITIRHLVHHTSGIRDYLGLWSLSGRSAADEIPEAVALDLIARQRAADFAPGARWSYSNSGYFLLSVIVKRASGQTLREFAEASVFGPLGMTSTHFHDDNTMIVPRRAEGYEPDGKGGFRIVRTSFALVGDGGLLSTVEDLLRYDGNFYANRLGSAGPALITQVTTPGKLASGKDLTYAFGLMIGEYRGLRTVRHGGSFIGFRAELLRFPEQRLSVAVLCNEYTASPDRLAERVAELYLGDRMKPSERREAGAGVAVAAQLLDRYVGRYELMPGTLAEVTRADDGLRVRAFGAPPARLVARSDSVFDVEGMGVVLEFRTLADGRKGLLMAGGAMEGPSPPLGPPPAYQPAELAGFAGRYVSEELDTWYTIEANGDTVRVRARLGEWVPLAPLVRDAFAFRGSRLAFERDRRGRITGFRLSAARSHDIGFVKQ